MRGPISNAGIVAAIMRKDLRAFSRDRLWLILTIAGLVFFIAFFWLLPSSTDETIDIGVYPADLGDALVVLGASEEQEGQGLNVVPFASVDELRAVVAGERAGEGADEDLAIGIAFPDDFAARLARGERVVVTLFVQGGVPVEVRDAMQSAVREIAYLAAAAATGGDPMGVIPVSQSTVVLGPDRAGDQVSLQERMRPMLAFFVLMMESLSLASLIAVEIQQGTATALLVTPARASHILAAKAVLGSLLAFAQAMLLLALTGSFCAGWGILVVAALLGAIIATGTAMISGSAGRDFIGTLFYGMALLIPLAIPAITVLLPGSPALWVRALPTYGVIEAFVGVTAYGESWGELWPALTMAAGWCVAILAGGLFVLQRKVRTR